MKNKINFISGEIYTLSELFSGERRIIIPDLQRDYCWGDEIHTDEKKELVSGFVTTLIEQFDRFRQQTGKKEELSLGLIYGYEAPENHIQLCDGQQRMTTLYLLLGILNRRSGCNAFRERLISDYEYRQDDKEPYLQYAIRETSLYFLSDLVCHFFIDESDDPNRVSEVGAIRESTWFFHEYRYDPSICSMLKALERIDEKIKDKGTGWCCEFGEFLTTRLTFLYYDMENRRNGEETFVVINTTGEPLSAPQNLKPVVFRENTTYLRSDEQGAFHTLPEDWEEIETWFWLNRQGDNDTADAGFNEFLRWCTMLRADEKTIRPVLASGRYAFPEKEIPFAELYRDWTIVRFLFEEWEHRELLKREWLSPAENPNTPGYRVIGQIDCLVLLPLIAFCRKNQIPGEGVSELSLRNLLRLCKFLQNLTRINNVSKNVNELVYDAIWIAGNCRDLVELTKPERRKEVSPMLLTEEEIRKLTILEQHPNDRKAIEETFWNAQDQDRHLSHKIWSGEILPLIEWVTDSEGQFHLDCFNAYLEKFDAVFVGECNSNIDLVRRALLTRNLKAYPRFFRGTTNYSFGWEWSDWQTLINENKEAFRRFFDDLPETADHDEIEQALQQMIDNFSTTSPWAEFIHRKELLEYCGKKNIQWDDTRGGWLLIKSTHATTFLSVRNMRLYLYLKRPESFGGDHTWQVQECQRNKVIVEYRNFIFQIEFANKKWQFELSAKGSGDNMEAYVEPLQEFGWEYNREKSDFTLTVDDNSSENRFEYPVLEEQLTEAIRKIAARPEQQPSSES